ncbi:MAG: CHASE3 domain-containing protein [Zoogloeaceae bacterium]|nr:CHASE3 domain-containing protein [Zoogloeaceae bacterium]
MSVRSELPVGSVLHGPATACGAYALADTPVPDLPAPPPRALRRLARAWPHVLLAVGCALALTLLVTSYYQSSLGLRALAQNRDQAARQERLMALQMMLVDAETGVRGYLLTAEPVYLEPYEQAITKIQSAKAQLQKDFAGLPGVADEMAEVGRLIDSKVAVMAQAVAARTLGDTPDNDWEGKLVMDELRGRLGQLQGVLAQEGQGVIGRSIERFKLTQVAGVLLAGGSLTLLVLLFSVMQRKTELRGEISRLLASENARLDEQVRARTAELNELARYLAEAREEEKARIARELHDELGALLTAAKLDAGWLGRKLPNKDDPQVAERLARLQRTLGEGISLKRRIIDDLQPPLLKDLGLVEALGALVDQFNEAGDVKVEAQLAAGAENLDRDRALALFRIVQEALTNVRKYAAAKTVGLSLSLESGAVNLRIEDDGRGFDPAQVAADRHGLAGMKHRVQTYSGRFVVESAPGKGTILRVSIPLA